MAVEVRRTPKATVDAEEIWLSIALDSQRAADRVARRLYEAEDRLGDYIELGRRRDEFPGVRSWAVGDYVIFYRIDADAVVVVRILHGARDLGDLLELEGV